MKKRDAIKLFGGKAIYLAKAVNKTKSAISQWPEVLDNNTTNIVIGAAIRHGIELPDDLKQKISLPALKILETERERSEDF